MIRVSIQRNLSPTNQPFHFNQTLNVSYVTQYKIKQSSKETKREVTFKKPSHKNKEETPNFFNKCKYGILWKLSHDTMKW